MRLPLADLFPIKTLILKGDFEQAQQALSQILAREPNSAQAWLQQGELNLMIGLFMEAEQAYRQAIAFSATNSYTAKLASARLNDLAGKIEQAQADYLSLVNAFPYNTELKMMLSEFYFLIEQHKKMEVLLQEVVKIDPNHPSAWFMLGRVAFLQGDFEKALNEYFVKALITAKKLKNRVQEGEALNDPDRAGRWSLLLVQQVQTDVVETLPAALAKYHEQLSPHSQHQKKAR